MLNLAAIFRKAKRAEVISSTVRPWEVYAQTRREQMDHAALIKRYVGWVYVAASRNATDVASVPVRVYSRNMKSAEKLWGGRPLSRKRYRAVQYYAGMHATKAFGGYDVGRVAEITDPKHPVMLLLSQPTPWCSGLDFIDLQIRYAELCGNAYAVKVTGPMGYPTELWPVQAQFVRIVPSRANFIDAYVYGRGTEIEQEFEPAEVMHLKYPNPHSVYYGMGPLQAAVLEADTSRGITQHSYSTLDNGAQPGLVIHGKNLTDNQRQNILAELERRYVGPNKAGRSLVFSGDVSVVQWAMSKQELGYLESAKDVRDTIAAIFDVSVSDLTSEDVNRANAEAGAARQERRAVRPRARRFEDALNLQVMPDFHDALGDDSLFVCFDPPEAEVEAATVLRVNTLYCNAAKPVLTLNEARAELMYEPIDGGDEMESEAEAEPDAGAEPMPEGDGKAGVVTDFRLSGIDAERAGALCAEVSRGEQAPEVVRAILLAMGLPPDSVAAMVAAAEAFEPKEPEPEPVLAPPAAPQPKPAPADGKSWYWLRDDHPREGVSTKAADPKEADIERIVLDWYAAVIGEVQEGDMNSLSLAGIRERFAEKMRDVLGSLLTEGASVVGASWDVVPQNALTFLDTYSLRLAGEVAASTQESIRVVVRDGIAAGKTNEDIRRDVMRELREEAPFRAERIARTEVSHALNKGRVFGWKELGYTGKEWVLSVNPCPICEALAAQHNEAIPIDEPFLKMGEKLDYTVPADDGTTHQATYVASWGAVDVPPVHPQCRCDIKGVR